MTDEKIYDPVGKLRVCYPNLMSITFSNQYVQNITPERRKLEEDIQNRSMMDLFQDFFRQIGRKNLASYYQIGQKNSQT